MGNIRKDFLAQFVLLILSAALAVIAGHLKIELMYLVAFVLTFLLLFALTCIPYKKLEGKKSTHKSKLFRPIRNFLLTLGTVVLFAMGLTILTVGYVAMRDKQRESNQQNTSKLVAQRDLKAMPLASIEPKLDVISSAANPSVNVERSNVRRSDVPWVVDFIRKYVVIGTSNKNDKQQWAYVISDEHHSDFPEFNEVADDYINGSGYRKVAIFRSSLIRDGKLDELYDADPVLMRNLGRFCDGLIVGRVKSSLIQDTVIPGVNTVELSIRVRIISTTSGMVQKELSLLERGAGFTITEAQTNAQQRAAQALKQKLKEALL